MKLVLALFLLIVPQLIFANTYTNEEVDYSEWCVNRPLAQETLFCSIGWGEWGRGNFAPSAECIQNIELAHMQLNFIQTDELKQVTNGKWGMGVFNFLIVPAVIDASHMLTILEGVKQRALQRMESANRHTCAAMGFDSSKATILLRR